MWSPGERHLRIVRIDDDDEQLDDLGFLDDSAAFNEGGLREEVTTRRPEGGECGYRS